jgi:hypothetical protein
MRRGISFQVAQGLQEAIAFRKRLVVVRVVSGPVVEKAVRLTRIHAEVATAGHGAHAGLKHPGSGDWQDVIFRSKKQQRRRGSAPNVVQRRKITPVGLNAFVTGSSRAVVDHRIEEEQGIWTGGNFVVVTKGRLKAGEQCGGGSDMPSGRTSSSGDTAGINS